MRSCDALILPSRDEPWGLVVNEAMTCGVPIIASDICGCVDDLVFHGRNGYIFPVNDIEKLAEAMLAIAQYGSKARAMGAASEEIIRPWMIERQAETIRMALVRMLNRQ
jgi:glycosyltransferase involved in cell wall biosynthesis